MGANWQYYQQQASQGGGRGQRPGGQQYGGGYTSGDFGGFEGGEFSDFFESFFGRGAAGGSSFGGGQGRTRAFRGSDLQAEMTVSLEDALHGATKQISLNGQALNLKIKQGIADGQILRLKGKGNPGANGGPAGDLLLTIYVAEHPRYKRKGDDLYFDQTLDVFTAMLGGKISVQTIDKTISMNIPAGTDSDKVFRLKGMGMPRYDKPDERGDAYARMSIITPKNLTEEQKEQLGQIANPKTASHA
jgi:curved DNA-binding protein